MDEKKSTVPNPAEASELIRARSLRSRRALLLATGGAAIGSVFAVGVGKAQSSDIKPDYNDLDSDARDVSNHFGRDDDTD